MKKLEDYQTIENTIEMIGWDFSCLADKTKEEPLPWSYETLVKRRLKPAHRLLDMGTGGGEFLLSLRHPDHLITVTEGYAPNHDLCLKRLKPRGIDVVFCEGDGFLPLPDATFDIVINRHESYNLEEVYRILKPGGFFITQQVGSENNTPLIKALLGDLKKHAKPFTLSREIERAEKAGFIVLDHNEAFPYQRYQDIEAVIFMAKIIQWEFPDFSVKRCCAALTRIEAIIQSEGYFGSKEHRFMFVARKQVCNHG